MMDCKMLLENSFEAMKRGRECPPENRLVYLSESIFDFTTYDSEMDELFAKRAVEVCRVINNRKISEYIKDPEQYKWFLIMCNMPFFCDKLDWGISIRGAWWSSPHDGKDIELDSYGLWIEGRKSSEPIKFTVDEWELFIAAVIEFAKVEE